MGKRNFICIVRFIRFIVPMCLPTEIQNASHTG